MIWSISESKTFRRCQRQWYFKNCVANAVAKKDPLRREAYVLSKLQSISAWRGQVVDTAISEFLVPGLNQKRRVTLAQIKAHAGRLFDAQLATARAHRVREADLSVSKLGSSFAALHCMEYGGNIPEDEIARARAEVDAALNNLFQLGPLAEVIKAARYLVTQRALSFKHSGQSVRAVPDLIAFFDDAAPVIVDWKVHVFGIQEAWLQLGAYAVALTSCDPHKDFPPELRRWGACDIRLFEAQLLTKAVREHRVTNESVASIDAYIADSVNQMRMALDERERADLVPEDFPVTANPDNCQRCPYRKICWEQPQ